MRLNHLDILEQCFRDKLRGYNKEDVDTFLHLIADDFKEMGEEIELLNKKLAKRDRTIAKLKQEAEAKPYAANPENLSITPDMIKEKAKRIINVAREHADQHKKKAEQELSSLRNEINKIKKEKKSLIENIKLSAQKHLAQYKNEK
ncbi:MAG TPA: DivIVA domain-containing protein [Nitrospinaceae bacterium]|jgi:cell division initiation protein|nr:hypothetical protein [Nitrospinota bacterium]MDP6335258.1 DivIVA domain-containing protein [Nitrospinaceae bacterium]HAX46786.1 hypothetical protein [Nitrospina sp.]MBV51882.1 hypothetical protein [Nitrospinota bacterium]MDP7147279.1 DivIVA domain-containing protein [Nitrospinaceae bacterium]|tara:strand:- start:1331 stop:1768 length:438 start_codon:yes stop_codon:yes gene_type:complete